MKTDYISKPRKPPEELSIAKDHKVTIKIVPSWTWWLIHQSFQIFRKLRLDDQFSPQVKFGVVV